MKIFLVNKKKGPLQLNKYFIQSFFWGVDVYFYKSSIRTHEDWFVANSLKSVISSKFLGES